MTDAYTTVPYPISGKTVGFRFDEGGLRMFFVLKDYDGDEELTADMNWDGCLELRISSWHVCGPGDNSFSEITGFFFQLAREHFHKRDFA